MSERVHVGLGDRAYDIEIGPGLIPQAGGLIAPLLRRKRVAVVKDETESCLHLAALQDGTRAGGAVRAARLLSLGEGTQALPPFRRTRASVSDPTLPLPCA